MDGSSNLVPEVRWSFSAGRVGAEAWSVVAIGTHLFNTKTEAAVLKALTLARKHGLQTALNINYRPNL